MAAMHFEQVQRFILAKKIFWGYGHFFKGHPKDPRSHVLIPAVCEPCARCV